MSSSPSTGRRVLIIGSDGMRPDAVTPERMPTYSRLIREGMLFKRFQAAYPSETRVSMTTLTTGVYPGRHGVIANWLHLPRFGEMGLQTGNHQQLFDYTRETGEQVVLSPTLGDRLAAAGMELGVAGASSPGAGLLWNIRRPRQVINVNTTYDLPELEAIHRKVGPAPDKGRHRERLEWSVKALLEAALPDPRNRALVLWLPQPDKASHDHGLGSPEFCEALGWVDACVARVLEGIEKRGEEIDIFFISDHGHSTVDAQGPLSEHLAKACRERGIDVPFDVTGKMIFAKAPIADEALRELIAWLKTEPWCGAVLAHHPLAREWGALPIETLYGPLHHERAPLLIVNPIWSPECNEAGVPGIVRFAVGPKSLATHGNAVPTDLSAFCLGYGPGFKAGAVSEVPCGIVDIAPTVCHLLGLDRETGFDGRVLHEGLSGSASLPPPESRFETHGEGTQRQPIRTAEVNGTRYLLG
ncbi:MAG TPA: alkaline phosphatase family protein [Chthoniobacteraceae bacterium]|nr:alkaline phosphatase family protein [Chthoniobacteraceae bacterium]